MYGCVFLLLMVLVTVLSCSASSLVSGSSLDGSRCLTGLPEVNPKYHLMYNGQILKFRIEMSDRITHQLVTNIVGIFVEEVLGYPDVEILQRRDNFNATEALQRLANETEEKLQQQQTPVPQAMANVELWVPPETNLFSLAVHEHFKETGIIAPPGRFGWFIPANYSGFLPRGDYYTTFTSPESAKVFSVTDEELKQLSKLAYDSSARRYYCAESYCSDGMYTPTWCTTDKCALLLTGFPDNTGFVVQHIETLKLFVRVIWVGPWLQKAMDQMEEFISKSDKERSFVILSWTPSTITVPGDKKFNTVSFPPCETYALQTGCKYDLHRLVKFMWVKLADAAKPIYDAIVSMHFSRNDYENLLTLYRKRSRNEDIRDVACTWMKQNIRTWSEWNLSNQEQNILFIGGIFPVSIPEYRGPGIAHASLKAVEAVNRNSTVLQGYTLHLLLTDGQCRSDVVMRTFVDYIYMNHYKQLIGILGPACSDSVEPLAGVARFYKTVVMSYSAEGSSFSDRKKYPYFFRTIGENHQYVYVYLQLLKKLQWSQVASITQDGTKYGEYISHLQDLLHANKITFVANRKFPADREKDAMNKYLLEMKNARIIIADIYNDAARDAMCQAYHLGMTAAQSYVWFLPLWLTPRWYDTDYYNREHKENISCTTEQMLKAINGHLGLTFAHYGSDDSLMQENITVGEWRKQYEKDARGKESIYGGYAYDAVWTYALALDKLMKMNSSYLANLHSDDTVRQLTENIEDTDFNGVSGRVHFGKRSSRLSVVHVVQWLDNKTHVVGTFQPNSTDPNGGTLFLNESLIKWLTPDGKRPDDGAEQCMIEWFAVILDVSCDKALIILNISAFLSLSGVMLIIFLVVKRRYDKKVQLTQRYWKSLGIDVLNPRNVGSLDKWEIPRDLVVINRKLGEGAFGFVYGGEAHFNEKGWVAVAVKTLKVGSTTEEKLDFLSEAEVMKRFEHKNIVKLLGVCTKNEPVYTVMEFMLYGDLKTFLLGRRHLVNERTTAEETDEVSSKKLTGMALDVARALSYLAELKYVHRDVASRNCLINGSRVVKLGDFGMTRPMFENDYYKFNRKGMLPVRWMAPESLGFGIFTPSSDVWSFGVLLYEIITFGSFPFQGLSNNQVLEHVTNGHTLTIPNRVKPQLDALIRSCWNQDAKCRPHASEIVEFLANNPRLLSPCLDVPLSSVQLESTTGQLSMRMPDKIRKFSITLRNRSGSASASNHRPPLWRIDSTDESPSIWSQADSPVETLPWNQEPYNNSQFSTTPIQSHIWDNPTENRLWNDNVAEPLLSTSNENNCNSKYVALRPAGNRSNNEEDNYCHHDTTQADSAL